MKNELKPHPKICIVEGNDEQYTIPNMMKAYIDWPDTDKWQKWPVFMYNAEGIDKIRDKSFLEVTFKNPITNHFGIVIDANESLTERYESLKAICQPQFPDIPASLPQPGYISAISSDGKKLGIWIMPDNRSAGMFETFLSSILADSEAVRNLWNFASECTTKAKNDYSAPYKDVHQAKAIAHNFLSWQDEPGRPLSIYMQHDSNRVFDTGHPTAKPFVDWFMQLFELRLRSADGS